MDAGLAKLLDLLRERSKTLVEMAELARFYLVDRVELEPKAARKHLTARVRPALVELVRELERLPSWEEADLEGAFARVVERSQLKLGQVAQPVRVALTGGVVSPGIFETMEALGRDRCLERISRAIELLEAGSAKAMGG